jgi:serine/threonine protein kinase
VRSLPHPVELESLAESGSRQLAADQPGTQDFLPGFAGLHRIIAPLQHPNAVSVYEIGRDNRDCLHFTMKCTADEALFKVLQGSNWRDRVTDESFPPESMVEVVIQARAYAHGVVYRGLKPENIWVTRPLIRWWFQFRSRRPGRSQFYPSWDARLEKRGQPYRAAVRWYQAAKIQIW